MDTSYYYCVGELPSLPVINSTCTCTYIWEMNGSGNPQSGTIKEMWS